MGLQELMNKYGHKPKMENWVKLKEADDKEYTELSFRISPELREYLDINEDRELVELQAIPEELHSLAESVWATWERIHSPEDLSEY